MKKLLLAAALLAVSSSGLVAQIDQPAAGSLTLLAGWDFNGQTSSTVASVNARYSQLYTSYYTAGSPVTTNPGNASYGTAYFNNAANGATFTSNRSLATANGTNYDMVSANLPVGNETLGDQTTNTRSILLSSTTVADNARAVFKVSSFTTEVDGSNTTTQAFENINVAYTARNGAAVGSGLSSAISWSYSLDGIAWSAIAASSSTIPANATNWAVYTADFSAIDAIEGVSTIWLGLNYSESAAGATTFLDNVAIYGTALAAVTIPEPSTYAAILGVAVVGFSLLRRRKAALVA